MSGDTSVSGPHEMSERDAQTCPMGVTRVYARKAS